MDIKENLHQGHRRRLMKKVDLARTALADHELLECLLFFAIPRQDTNPLAHKLLKRFGDISRVFCATKEELVTVDGIGEKTAELILLIGEILERSNRGKKKPANINCSEKLKLALRKEFSELSVEASIILLLDKNHNEITQLVFESKKVDEVDVDFNEVAKAFSVFHPRYLILAHNHPCGECYPSKEDDTTTKKLQLLCAIHGINLIEHAIFKGEDGFYSYHEDGRLQMIKKQADLNNLMRVEDYK